MNNFISSLYVWIDLVKAIGPIIIGIFGAWIAYGQFKLSKSQSKISQEQLALAKQQADIAQKKVELDIRDKKYEIFRRWNEAYYQVLYPPYSLDVTTYLQYYKYLEEKTKELEFIFNESQEFYISVKNIIIQSGKLFDIKVEINKFELKSKTHELDDEQKIHYQSQLAPIMLQMNKDRNIVQKIFYEEFKL